MGKKANREFWESAKYNNMGFIQYYDRLIELSISMFEWKNVPDSIDVRFLELSLFTSGQAVFFKDDVVNDLLALRCIPQGNFNVYGIPINRLAMGYNGYQCKVTEEDSVIVYNNLLKQPSRLDVELFAKRLYELDRIIDVNVKTQKTPILISCDETQKLSMKNLYLKYEGNEPVIFTYDNLGSKPISVLKTDAPYVADKLYQLKVNIWNEALTYLGISNVTVNKKERLITDEVERSQGGVIASRYSRLQARKTACEKINKMFGTNIKCEYRESYNEDIDDSENIERGGRH